jgi:hypothetical protein
MANDVIVTTPIDGKAFDTLLTRLPQQTSVAIRRIGPEVAIVTNMSDRRIVAYSIAFRDAATITTAHHVTYVQFKSPFSILSFAEGGSPLLRQGAILPGHMALVTPTMDVTENTPDAVQQLFDAESRMSASDRLLNRAPLSWASIDATIFSDGHLRGPDRSDLARHFALYTGLYVQQLEAIAVSLRTGASLTDALSSLWSTPPPSHSSGDRDVYEGYWTQSQTGIQALADVAPDGRVLRNIVASAAQIANWTLIRQ